MAPNSVGYTTYALPSTIYTSGILSNDVVEATSKDVKKTRIFTGNPKGKNEEEKLANIRKRKSYEWLVTTAKFFRERGISVDCLPVVLGFILNKRCMYKGGFAYSSHRLWARQSFDVFVQDIKDFNRLCELGLK